MKKVMLVEDEELILQGIRNIIDWEELGLQVVHMAHHGEEALAMWKKEPVDIIVTDLEMPVMGGLDLLRKLRQEDDRVRFIILTGYDEFAYAREAIRLEVENYLLKPIDEEALIEQLKETIEKLDETDRARHQYAEEKNDWLHFLSGKLPGKEEEKGHEYDEIRDNMLGWDITDYGLGKFDEVGFALITIRNGNVKNKKYTKTYAEKLLMVNDGQMAPMHFHWNKMEDIINRGGGNVLITVYNSTEDGQFADTDVTVNCDGREFTVPAGTQIKLTPGESITIYPYMYHDFHVEEGSGAVLLGEVSMCNDDENDNRFYEPIGRFPEIEEDEPAYRLLCNEYPAAK